MAEKRCFFNLQEEDLIKNTVMGQKNYLRKYTLPYAEITELQKHTEAALGMTEQMSHCKKQNH